LNKNKKITLIITLSFLIVSLFSFSLSAAVQGEIKDMNFKGADIRDVLRAIAEVAQVNLVTDSSVQGNITIHLRDISFDEALNLITQTTGLAYKWDGNTVVVATPERIEEVYADMDTRIINFDNKDLNKVKSVVNSIYPELNIQIIKENTQLLLVGKTDIINEAVNLIDRVDFPTVETAETQAAEEEQAQQENPPILEIVKIEHGNLSEVVNNIKTLYPELIVQTDTNNDQIILKGQESVITEAKDLIARIDIPTPEEIEAAKQEEQKQQEEQEVQEVTKFVKIDNISPDELMSKINEVYPDMKMSYDQINQQLIIRGTEKQVQDAMVLVNRFDQAEKKRTEIVSVDYLELENINTIVGNNIPEVNLSTNTMSKEIVISGKDEDVTRAVNLVENLDMPRRQVVIEARVEEISTSESETMGIASPENNLPQIQFTKDPQGQIDGISASWPDYLTALEREGKAETLANPRLMTLNGETGKMLIGERIPVKGVNADGEVTISYIEAGITLEFEPWITKENYIELQVSPKVSSLGEELYEGYPSIRTREVSTRLRLKDGQTFAIGGLIQEDMQNSVTKVPILSEIPILGELFKYENDDTEKTELVIFITPRIVEDNQREAVKNSVSPLNQTTAQNETKMENTEKEEQTESDSDTETEADTDNESEETTDNDSEENQNSQSSEETQTETASSQSKVFSDLSEEELQDVLNTSRKTRKYDKDIPDNLNVIYTVQANESIQDIAYKYGISAEEISMANDDQSEFVKGDIITLPIPGSHLVRMGENQSIQSVMNEYDVTLKQILRLNNLKSVEQIKPDMIVVLPKEVR